MKKTGTRFPAKLHVSLGEGDREDSFFDLSPDLPEFTRAEASGGRYTELQRHLMRLATDFINVHDERYDDAIRQALAMVGHLIGADQAYLFTFNFHAGLMSNTHEWCAYGIGSVIDDLQDLPMALFPEMVETHSKGEINNILSVSELAPGTAFRRVLDAQRVRSLLTLPLMQKEECLGFVGFNAMRAEREWLDEEIAVLRTFADLLANLGARVSTERDSMERGHTRLLQLETCERRYRGLIESEQSLIIRADLNGCITFANEAYCQMVGKPLEDLIGQRFLPSNPLEDMQTTHETMPPPIATPCHTKMEHRSLTVNGWRWIAWETIGLLGNSGQIVELQSVGHDITHTRLFHEGLIRETRQALYSKPKHGTSPRQADPSPYPAVRFIC